MHLEANDWLNNDDLCLYMHLLIVPETTHHQRSYQPLPSSEHRRICLTNLHIPLCMCHQHHAPIGQETSRKLWLHSPCLCYYLFILCFVLIMLLCTHVHFACYYSSFTCNFCITKILCRWYQTLPRLLSLSFSCFRVFLSPDCSWIC